MTTNQNFDRLESLITNLMRVGVALSSSVLIVGLVMFFAGAPVATTVLNTGIVLLMLIPATRIVISLIDATLRRDTLLAVSTAIVIVVLTCQVLGWFDRWTK